MEDALEQYLQAKGIDSEDFISFLKKQIEQQS